jgi:hypothetical protein
MDGSAPVTLADALSNVEVLDVSIFYFFHYSLVYFE